MNDNENNEIETTTGNAVSSQSIIAITSEAPGGDSVFEMMEFPLTLTDFFEHCRQICAQGQSVSMVLDGIAQFKKEISNILKCSINTFDELQRGLEKIKPFLDFWLEYGEYLSSIVKNADDAQNVCIRYQNYPELETQIAQLKVDISNRESRIKELEESEIRRQLTDANEKNSVLQEELSNLRENYQQLQDELNAAKNENNLISVEKQELSREYENLKDKNAQDQISYHAEIDMLQKKILSLHTIAGLVADAFKIGTNEGPEFDAALASIEKILRQWIDDGRNKPIGESLIEIVAKEKERLNELEHKLQGYANENARQGRLIDAQEVQLTAQEHKLDEANVKITILTKKAELDKQNIETLQASNCNNKRQLEVLQHKFYEANGKITTLTNEGELSKQAIEKLERTNSEKEAQLAVQYQQLAEANEKNKTLTKAIESYKQNIEELNSSKETLQRLNNGYQNSLDIRNAIIQCFNEVSDDISRLVNTIEQEGCESGNLEKLKEVFRVLCIQNNRMADIDALVKENEIEPLNIMSMRDILRKFKDYDFTKQQHDIYLDFIGKLMKIRGKQWYGLEEPSQQEYLFDTLQEYKRILVLCQDFEEIRHSTSEDINMDLIESHRTEMYSALEQFFQYASKSTNESLVASGSNLYQKLISLPDIQKKLSNSIETAIFGINFSGTKLEAFDELQKKMNELQLKCERQGNVLNLLEKKLYPNFMTAQNLGRRDKLINDIEFGLTNDSNEALLLKSYLGLLGCAERYYDDFSMDTLIWILKQLPKALYNFYTNTILEGAVDISSDEEVYDVMNQLMNKINRFILKGKVFLSMPRLGSAITLDSMEVPEDEKPTFVNTVFSWMISDSCHRIIQNAIVG